MKCILCNKEFKNLGNHLRYNHTLNAKEYYDKYIKKDNEGLCLTCKNPTEFLGVTMGYREFCCVSCSRSNERTQLKYAETNISKYGVPNAGAFGGNIYKKAIKDKYNVNNISQNESIKVKKEQTFLKNHGIRNNFGNKKVLNKAIKNSGTFEANSKRQLSMLQNGHHSSLEDLVADKLDELNILYKHEYNKDKRYPFKVDFYLPETDIFIEINNHWTHNTHFFDSNNKDDIDELNKWKRKAKKSNYYKSAIKTWTQNDLLKLEYATKNKLKYIVLWNKTEVLNYLNYLT